MSYSNPICYARVMGDCSTDNSKEHWMPECMLSVVSEDKSTVLTRNHTFQNGDELKAIGISGLQSRVLCTTHNNQLADFDAAGCLTLKAVEQINARAGDESSAPETFKVNGDNLERCMLKILCGALYTGAYPINGVTLKDVQPPDNWLNILYRNQPFPKT